MRAAMGLPIMRARWEQIKKWYPENERKFIDGMLINPETIQQEN